VAGKDVPDAACADPAQPDIPASCAPGYYSIAHDVTCFPCPKGHYCENAATATPVKCAAGTFADEGQSTCGECPNEYYAMAGSEYCSPIPPGYKLTTAGTFPSYTTYTITACPHKTYSRWGEKDCADCPDGYLCPQQSADGYLWQNSCPRGSYCKKGVEIKCPAGKYGTKERASLVADCEDCPPGYNCLEGTGDFELVPCPKGGYCEKGKTVVACPAGTFNDDLYGRSIADCKSCPIGQTCAAEATGGTLCPATSYCPRGSLAGSIKCPAGTHGNSQTGKKDMTECLPCPPGHYCPEGSATPTPAPAGKYTPLIGMPDLASLYKCPPTFYCA
jgi:hypothetical protein